MPQIRICKKCKENGRNIAVKMIESISRQEGRAWYRCPECETGYLKEDTEILPFDEKAGMPEDAGLIRQAKVKKELEEKQGEAVLSEPHVPEQPVKSEAEEKARKQIEREKEMDK